MASEPASTVVTSLADVVDATDGVITLREAITVYANDGDAVTFAPSLKGGTIVLSGSQIVIDKAITVSARSLLNKADGVPGITIDANSASRIFRITGDTVWLDSLAFAGGNGGGAGGAVYAYQSTLTISNSTFQNNVGTYGGALYADSSMLTISNSSFQNNSVSGEGGGAALNAYRSTLVVSNVDFQNNAAYYGGAIYSSYSTLSISDANFQGNAASGLGGGAIGAQVSTLNVSNATFQNNTASYGGAIDASSSALSVSNSTLTRNTALNASVFYLTSANVRVFNATIYGNSASNSSSNRTIFVSANSHLDLHNTIVAGNSGADVYKADVRSVVSAYNVLSGYKGWTNADAVVFAYDSSKPLFTNAAQDDYTLAPGSQAINKGDDVYVYAEKDLAGNARVSFDAVDLGAYEYGNQLEAPKIKSSSSTHNTITVSWNAIANATGYVVAYKSPADSAYIEAQMTTSTTFTIDNLVPETEYKVKVLAKGDGTDYSDSLYGSVKTVVTKVASVDPTPLTVPTWKTSSSTGTSVTVAWNPVANASGYVVEYKSANDAGYTSMPKTTATTITIPNLAPETTYKLRVYATGDGVNYSDSGYSTIKAVKTKTAPVTPEQPSTVVTSLADTVNAYDNVVTLREAITVYANDGDTVTFAAALKGGTIDINDGEIVIEKAITVDASALWNAAQNAPGVTLDANSTSRIFVVAGKTVTLKSLAFAGGNVSEGESAYGGAILAISSTLTISNSTFIQNQTATNGGAISAISTSLTIVNSTFNDNHTGYGGAIYAKDCPTLSISNSTFSNNNSYWGGAIGADASTLTISNTTFQNNAAEHDDASGGAIDVDGASSLTISNSTFEHNTTNNLGGAIFVGGSSTATISSSNLQNNSASQGGAIYVNHSSTIDATNLLLANNSGEWGAAVELRGTMSLRNSTITDNNGTQVGGVDLDESAVLNVYNSIIAGNTGSNGADVYQYSDECQTNAWNVLSSYAGWDSGSNPLTYNANLPLFNNAAAGDYTLAAGSQAINKGANDYVTTQTDLAGNPRVIGGTVDLGAYEYGDPTPTPDPTPLTAPTWKTSSSTYYSVTVAWNPVANASGYVVEYKSSTDSDYTVMPQTTATSITISGLAPETTYKLRVYAAGDGVNYSDSGYSTIKAVKTKIAPDPVTPLDAPTWKSSSSTGASVTVAWNPVANASGYVVEYKGPNDADYTVMPQTTATTVTVPGLAPETTYKLRVYAAGDGVNYSNSVYSTVKAVKTKTASPEPASTVVTSLADTVNAYDNVVTLREAITVYASAGDTVTFAPALKGGTITLGGEQIEITKSLKLDASALWDAATNAPGVTIDANYRSQILCVNATDESGPIVVEIDSLAFAHGSTTTSGDYYSGGAIYAGYDSTLTISNSVFNANLAGEGGAIYFSGSTLNISGSIFIDNDAEDYGGAIYAVEAYQANVSDSVFDGNGCGMGGGAIAAFDTTLNVSGVEFHDNSTWMGLGSPYGSGGAVSVEGGTLNVSNSVFCDNGVDGWGGAVNAEHADVVITNSTFTQNEAFYGSALSLHDSHYNWSDDYLNVQLSNVTITDNTTVSGDDSTGGGKPGAIFFSGGADARLNVYNSIVVGNQDGDVCLDDAAEGSVNAYKVLSAFSGWSNGNAGVVGYESSKPLFTNAAQGDYTLAAGSQAINKGANAYVTTQTDLAGNTRIIGGTVDLGAYEFGDPTPTPEPTPLDAPTWKSSSSTGDSVTVAWNADANASGYVVEYKGPNDANYTVVPQTTATTVTVSGLAPETTYKLRVYAVGDGVNYSDSDYSAIKAVKTKTAPMTVVTSLADTVDANDGVVTLREAITVYANDGDTITFAPALKGGTITLGGSEIEIVKSIKIDASALRDEATNAPGITIDAASRSGIFVVGARGTDDEGWFNYAGRQEPVEVEIDSLALTHGRPVDSRYGQGGAILCLDPEYDSYYDYSVTLTVANSEFYENAGAAVCAQYSTLNISNSKFHDNVDSAVNVQLATINISNSEFSNNVSNSGGALCMYGPKGTITNSSFTQNEAEYGGALFISDASQPNLQLRLSNLTIADNTTTTENDYGSAAIYWQPGSGTMKLDVDNSIVVNNQGGNIWIDNSYWEYYTPETQPGWFEFASSANVYNVLVELNDSDFNDWSNGTAGVIGYDASKPLFTDAANGDYTLAAGSQAVNRGDNAYVTSPTDLAGNTRIIGGTVDLGAYEYEGEEAFVYVYYDYAAKQAEIYWDELEGAAYYNISYTTDVDATPKSPSYARNLTTSGVLSGINVGRTYTISVTGYDAAGLSVGSATTVFAPVAFTTSSSSIYTNGVPLKVYVNGSDDATATVKWGVEHADGSLELLHTQENVSKGYVSYTPSGLFVTDVLMVYVIGEGVSKESLDMLSFTSSNVSQIVYDPENVPVYAESGDLVIIPNVPVFGSNLTIPVQYDTDAVDVSVAGTNPDGTTRLTVNWSAWTPRANVNVSGYQLQVRTLSGAVWETLPATYTTKTAEIVNSGDIEGIRVVALGSNGSIVARTDDAYASFYGFSLRYTAFDHKATISWDNSVYTRFGGNVENVKYYRVVHSTGSGGYVQARVGLNNREYSFVGAFANTDYIFSVDAMGADGKVLGSFGGRAALSSRANVNEVVAPLGGVYIVHHTFYSTATLTWAPFPGATSYSVYKATNGGSFMSAGSGLSEPTCDVGVSVGTTYTIKVEALGNDGKVLARTTTTFTPIHTGAPLSVLDEAFADFFEEELFEDI